MTSPPTRTDDRRTAAETVADWRIRLDAHGEIHGMHRVLDARHGVVFTDEEADTLLVSFETAAEMRENGVGLPEALRVAGREGWSQLCLYCEGDSFFRTEAVFAYIDELVDSGFFDGFGRVVFYGAGPCGYAAAAFSVAAPGAIVVLARPLATLDPARAGWDHRYPALRRADFTSRYGYAPEMLEAASRVFLIFDPEIPADAIHAALFNLPEESLLRCRRLGPAPERDLERMGVLALLLSAAGHGRLDAATFFRLYRRRRSYRPYLQRILTLLRTENRAGLYRLWANGVRAQIAPDGQGRATG
ncbi:phosphoadenosine phosphosulfate reductase [Tropicimonas sp. IMCC6043]|uniref:phosphoadenosine phosphosulfate reductase n=1 Tax=Tropicimonas sp. IMCC6043 TaxID=2510645 RepID=UPI00101DAAEC|nr:phosphoadenosine phosphosulfate reductase [Tropicimonas sp. IMCC6043]RYH08426.1 phosphoadenosine phosphosulfate reductase [Tropicimonas sp. IMCC6043]